MGKAKRRKMSARELAMEAIEERAQALGELFYGHVTFATEQQKTEEERDPATLTLHSSMALVSCAAKDVLQEHGLAGVRKFLDEACAAMGSLREELEEGS